MRGEFRGALGRALGYDRGVARWVFLYDGARYLLMLSGALGHPPVLGLPADLQGFRVVPHGSGLSYLLPAAPEATVQGTVWQVDDDEMDTIDDLHGARADPPLYRGISVDVTTPEGVLPAIAYVGARIAEAP